MRTYDPLPLHLLPEDQWGIVTDVSIPFDTEDHDLVLRLMELGFVPGERVRIIAEAKPGHDPLAVRVGNTTFALRKREASFILVKPA